MEKAARKCSSTTFTGRKGRSVDRERGSKHTQCNSFNYRPRLRGRQLNSTGVFDKYALGRMAPAGLALDISFAGAVYVCGVYVCPVIHTTVPNYLTVPAHPHPGRCCLARPRPLGCQHERCTARPISKGMSQAGISAHARAGTASQKLTRLTPVPMLCGIKPEGPRLPNYHIPPRRFPSNNWRVGIAPSDLDRPGPCGCLEWSTCAMGIYT